MDEVMQVANSAVLWIIALLIASIVIFQAIMFMRLASKTRESVDMDAQDVRAAIRTGAINAIGPSFAIVVVAISLITLIGDPATLMRIGIIGNAAIESVGASLGSQATGAEVGGDGYNLQAFTNAIWVMCLGGMGWLLFVAH